MKFGGERFRAVMAPETGEGAAAPAVETSAAPAPANPEVASAAASPPAEATPGAASQPSPPAEAAPVESPKAETTPSLLEAASGKPPADAKASDGAASPDQPAPAEAAKPDTAEAKPEGDAKSEAKADYGKKDEAAKASDPAKEATAEPQPPAPVKYEAFKVPDGIKLDDKQLAQFTEIAGNAQVKQEDAQRLFDLHVGEMQKYANAVAQEQRRVWDTLNDGWKSELRNDPTLGGNRLETSLSMAKAVIEEYGGTPEQKRDLLAHTSNNGMGNYPGFVRLLHNVATALNIFEDKMVPADPSPPKAPKSPGNRGWYAGMGNGSQP